MHGRDAQTKAGGFDRQKLLQEHPLFSGLPAEIIERLSSYAVMRDVKRGTTIFTKGDVGNSLFAVCEGTVKMTSPSADGKDAVFNMINEGAIFGEIALLDGRTRTADAVAATDCQLMVIDRRDFLPLLRSQQELAIKIIDVLCARLRRTSEQVEDQQAAARVAGTQVDQARARRHFRPAAGCAAGHCRARSRGRLIGAPRRLYAAAMKDSGRSSRFSMHI
jgi:CRP-like cAMP-binding protein